MVTFCALHLNVKVLCQFGFIERDMGTLGLNKVNTHLFCQMREIWYGDISNSVNA